MKQRIVLLLTALILTANAEAQEVLLQICAPTKQNTLVRQVLITRSSDYKYQMIIVTVNPAGQEEKITAPAQTFGDMDYSGYYAETLDANIQYDNTYEDHTPADQELEWQGTYLDMICTVYE